MSYPALSNALNSTLARVAMVVVGSSLLTPLTASANDWSMEYSRSGVTMYSSVLPNSSVNVYRAEIVLPYSTDQVVAILSDIERYKEFMPNTVESSIIERKAVSEQREIALIYQRLDLPTISDRDFVVKADTRRRTSSLGNFWTIDFQPNEDSRAPKPGDDVVRVKVVSGKWLLTPIKDGKATHLTAIRHMELGGNVPSFMVNSGLRDGLHETLIKLRDRCRTQIR